MASQGTQTYEGAYLSEKRALMVHKVEAALVPRHARDEDDSERVDRSEEVLEDE